VHRAGPQTARIGRPGLLARRAARRLRRVPWRHAWIVALAVLLLILALFGLFRQH